MNILKYMKTAQIAMQAQTNGGIIYLLPNIFVKLLYLLPLLFLWRQLAASGADVGMGLQQMLTYTYISVLLSDLLVVRTFASSWGYEGKLTSLFQHPLSIFGQIAAQSIGGWIPLLLLFSLPMLCAAPLFGLAIVPVTSLFFPSLLLYVTLDHSDRPDGLVSHAGVAR